VAGSAMAREITQQVGVLRSLIGRRDEVVASLREVLPPRTVGVTLVARGTSANAALYGRYLLEVASGHAVRFAAPSVHTVYGRTFDETGHVAVGVSQSGRTPEIIDVLGTMQRRGAVGVAITNEPDSPLAATADVVVSLGAGREEAVPATKTFTAQLVAFALLSEALGAEWPATAWSAAADAVADVVADEVPAVTAAPLVDADEVVCTARGYLLGVAHEVALKLRETAGLHAVAYSAAELRHGPIAAVTPDVAAVALVAPGAAGEDTADVAVELRRRGGHVLVVGPTPDATLRVPAGLPEPLAALPIAVRGQQLALACALRRGRDPDRPAGLSKVTMTE
jgi:glutamine---fructose-6-phosphate transaminase (isomerizing)